MRTAVYIIIFALLFLVFGAIAFAGFIRPTETLSGQEVEPGVVNFYDDLDRHSAQVGVAIFEDLEDGFWIRVTVSQYLDAFLEEANIRFFMPTELIGHLGLRPYGAQDMPVEFFRLDDGVQLNIRPDRYRGTLVSELYLVARETEQEYLPDSLTVEVTFEIVPQAFWAARQEGRALLEVELPDL
jgi:hypothetical protein